MGVLCSLRVNSNASLQRAQWSTLYPCMSRSTGTAAWLGGGARAEGEEGSRGVRVCVMTIVIFVRILGLPTLSLLAWHTHLSSLLRHSDYQHTGKWSWVKNNPGLCENMQWFTSYAALWWLRPRRFCEREREAAAISDVHWKSSVIVTMCQWLTGYTIYAYV